MNAWKYAKPVCAVVPALFLVSCTAPSRYSSESDVMSGNKPTGASTFFTKDNRKGVEMGCQGNTSWGYISSRGTEVDWASDSSAHFEVVAIQIKEADGRTGVFAVSDPLTASPTLLYARGNTPRSVQSLAGIIQTAYDQCEHSVRSAKELGLGVGAVAQEGSFTIGVTGYQRVPAHLEKLANTYRATGQLDDSGYNGNRPVYRFSLRETLESLGK